MSDLLHEQLSALIDGELPAAETALLLKRLEREPELRRRLARYHACGESLRGVRVRVRTDFTLRLRGVLAEEPAHAAPAPRRAALRFLKPLAGLAVAAAVAGAAILVLGRPPAPAGAPAQTAQLAAAPAATSVPATQPAPGPAKLADARAPGSEPASYVTPQARPVVGTIPSAELANYALAHSGVAGPLGVRSMLTSLASDEGDGTPAR